MTPASGKKTGIKSKDLKEAPKELNCPVRSIGRLGYSVEDLPKCFEERCALWSSKYAACRFGHSFEFRVSRRRS